MYGEGYSCAPLHQGVLGLRAVTILANCQALYQFVLLPSSCRQEENRLQMSHIILEEKRIHHQVLNLQPRPIMFGRLQVILIKVRLELMPIKVMAPLVSVMVTMYQMAVLEAIIPI